MRAPRFLQFFAIALCALSLQAADQLGWPEVSKENKPWTRWWWPGSAVDKASLTQQLEQFAAAGIGGVEITPIYGALGYEDRYLAFLSPKWVEMLEHVAHEGQRLGLGVDMATGTGWPFGGPWIDEASGSQRAALLEGRITSEPVKMMVKRAAPGDEGLVIDPYSPDALRRYLAPFDRALAKLPRGLVRSQFHDSFEYFGANWTPKLTEVFQQMHGYNLQPYAAELLAKPEEVKTVNADTLGRIKSDYRETLARLHLDYLRTWVQWSHDHGYLVRNQSHGAPGNLLDLYANADIAETEIFGSTPFPIPGLRRAAEEVRHDQDLPESLVIRMAASAAHVVGHNLASSESLTWLREHWKESPSYMKPELDRILCDGINHIFYHGTVFSPQDAPWPGWLFYASTQFNPNNPLWEDLGALNRYVARVQSVLQRGQPDNDILLYWPFADVIDGSDALMKQFTVHNVKWLTEQPVGKLAQQLMGRGYSFDYISDAQLQQTQVDAGALKTAGVSYKILVVPATRRMPAATLEHIAQLAQAGAKVIFESLPEDVPGLGRLEARRAEFKAARGKLEGRASVQRDIPTALAGQGIPREAVAESGVSFIRRATASGHDYFFANLTDKHFDRWAPLGVAAQTAVLLNPLNGVSGKAALKSGTNGTAQLYLQLAPGETVIVRTSATRSGPGPEWAYRTAGGSSSVLSGQWALSFIKGGPELPPALATAELKSWADLGGSEAQRFAGTARYRIEFEAPATKADDWLLDLGEVRETARVRLNGRSVGTLWSLPFQVRIGEFLRPGRNILELEVTNLAANRIRDLDQRGVKWRIMREINFVNINYQPFDASGWALTPSGLLGPVTLTPLRTLKP